MNPTPAQRAAYHEADRAHGIPALAAWVGTLAAAVLAAAVQTLARSAA